MTDADYPEGYVVPFDAWHFHCRVYERYFCLRLPYGAYSAILGQLRAGRALRLEIYKRQIRRSLWLVRIHKKGRGNVDLFVLYQGRERRLITALKPTASLRTRAKEVRANCVNNVDKKTIDSGVKEF